MNWQSVSFDWNHVRAFLATAEEGSLSAAARALGQTQPTLGRQVSALERDLGVVLFERAGRSLILTPSGLDLLDHVRAMRDAAANLSLAASGRAQTIEGTIRITASEVMAAQILPPAILRLRQAAPRLVIDLVADDGLRDLQRREADIAIRHIRPEQPDLIARKVHDAKARLYAATAYLDRRGRPRALGDLKHHDFVSYGDPERMLGYLNPLGMQLTTDNLRVGSASGIVGWALVAQGLGISIMSDHVAQRTPGIECVLPDMEPVTFPVWLTTHRELHLSRRIRIVFDLLADFLSSDMR